MGCGDPTRILIAGIGLLALAACAPVEPIASSRFDGRYSGTRHSADPALCGLSVAMGRASARIEDGRITLQLFGPHTVLEGTVGEDGAVRASGMWTPKGTYFPAMTVLQGWIRNGELTGEATDYRCRTQVDLRRVRSPPALPVPPLPPRRTPRR